VGAVGKVDKWTGACEDEAAYVFAPHQSNPHHHILPHPYLTPLSLSHTHARARARALSLHLSLSRSMRICSTLGQHLQIHHRCLHARTSIILLPLKLRPEVESYCIACKVDCFHAFRPH
jgi:hypothetical protein